MLNLNQVIFRKYWNICSIPQVLIVGKIFSYLKLTSCCGVVSAARQCMKPFSTKIMLASIGGYRWQYFLAFFWKDAGNTDVEYDITEPVRKRRKPDTTEDQGSSGSTETQDQGKHSVLSSKQSSKILQSFGRTSVAGKSPLSSRKEEGSATGEKWRQATIRSPRKERGKGNIHTQNLS